MKWIKSKATRGALDQLIGFVTETARNEIVTTDKFIMETRLICEEILVNIMDYAYDEADGFLEVGFDYDSDSAMMTLIFKDEGAVFDPTAKEDPDITKDIMEREIGGLGIFMVKKLSDSVVYEREENANVLTVRKQVF